MLKFLSVHSYLPSTSYAFTCLEIFNFRCCRECRTTLNTCFRSFGFWTPGRKPEAWCSICSDAWTGIFFSFCHELPQFDFCSGLASWWQCSMSLNKAHYQQAMCGTLTVDSLCNKRWVCSNVHFSFPFICLPFPLALGGIQNPAKPLQLSSMKSFPKE